MKFEDSLGIVSTLVFAYSLVIDLEFVVSPSTQWDPGLALTC
jgi:hypothetical protein